MEKTIEIRSLDDINDRALYTCFSEAFKGYARSWTQEELFGMLKRRGYQPELSFGAFDGDVPVSFTFNCTGIFNGIATAYDSGTGTLEAYRRKGLSTRIFEYAIPYFSKLGLKQYLLEVITTNETAISVYKKAGFEIVRDLNSFAAEVNKLKPCNKKLPVGFSFTESELPHEEIFSNMSDCAAAWQNNYASLKRAEKDLKILHVIHENNLAGCGIIEPSTGDVPYIAIANNYRKQGLGSLLLDALVRHAKTTTIKVINLDASFKAGHDFLQKKGMENKWRQYEMIKKLED